MPLIKDGRFVNDPWVRPDGSEATAAAGRVILPLDRLATEGVALRASGRAAGADIPNDVDLAVLAPWLPLLALIAIAFPKSADGRGFTIARRLRRAGFTGELRASGHIIADQYAAALACGFDTVEISPALAARQPEAHWTAASRKKNLGYQQGYRDHRSILAARWEY